MGRGIVMTRLTDDDKVIIEALYKDFTDDHLSEIIGKPSHSIRFYRRKNGLRKPRSFKAEGFCAKPKTAQVIVNTTNNLMQAFLSAKSIRQIS